MSKLCSGPGMRSTSEVRRNRVKCRQAQRENTAQIRLLPLHSGVVYRCAIFLLGLGWAGGGAGGLQPRGRVCPVGEESREDEAQRAR
jgi:hypothetical protein